MGQKICSFLYFPIWGTLLLKSAIKEIRGILAALKRKYQEKKYVLVLVLLPTLDVVINICCYQHWMLLPSLDMVNNFINSIYITFIKWSYYLDSLAGTEVIWIY